MSFSDIYCCRIAQTTVSEKDVCSAFLVQNNYTLFDSFISDSDCCLCISENSAQAKSDSKRKQKVPCLKEAIFIGLFPGFLELHHFLLALSWRFILAENRLRDLKSNLLERSVAVLLCWGLVRNTNMSWPTPNKSI